MVEISSLAVTRGNRTELKLLLSLIPRELSLFDLFDGFLEDPICKAVFIWPDLEHPQHKKSFPWECLSKKNTGNCLTS